MPKTIDLGPVSAYAVAVANGYRKTEQEWIEDLLNVSNNASNAAKSANDAKDYYDSMHEDANDISNTILVQDTMPEDAANKAWFKTTGLEYELAEIQDLDDALTIGGVELDLEDYDLLKGAVSSTNTILNVGTKYNVRQIPLLGMWKSLNVEAESDHGTFITFLKTALTNNMANGTDISSYLAQGETGRHEVASGETELFVIPEDAVAAVINVLSNNNDYTPKSVSALSAVSYEIAALNDSISDLNESKLDAYYDRPIDFVETFGDETYPLGWRTGYYNGTGANGGGTDYLQTNRTKYYTAQSGDKSITFSVPEGYHAAIVEYDENGENGSRTPYNSASWDAGASSVTVEVTEGHQYKFCVGKWSGNAGEYITEEFIASMHLTVSTSVINWQEEQDVRIDSLSTQVEELQSGKLDAYYAPEPKTLQWIADFSDTNRPLCWSIGSYSASSGATNNPGGAIRSNSAKPYVAGDNDISLSFTVPEGLHPVVFEYDENDTFVTAHGSRTSGDSPLVVEPVAGHKYKFSVGGLTGTLDDYLNETFINTLVAVVTHGQNASWEDDVLKPMLKFAPMASLAGDIKKTVENSPERIIPDYYTSSGYLQDKLNVITRIQKTLSGKNDAFLLIADYHVIHNEGHSFALLKEVAAKTGIQKIFFAGDIGGQIDKNDGNVVAMQRSAKAWSQLAECTEEFWGVLGNHEWIDGSFGLGTMFNVYLNRFKTRVPVMSDYGSYYVDDPFCKIRYYFLQDTIGASIINDFDWFGKSVEAIEDGWYVAVVVHHGFIPNAATIDEYDGAEIPDTKASHLYAKIINKILDAYQRHTTVSTTMTHDGVSTTYSWDFTSSSGGGAIGIFCGHFHHGTLWGKDHTLNEWHVPVFRASTDSLHAASVAISPTDDISEDSDSTQVPWYWENAVIGGTQIARRAGTTDEQCFYAVQIDMTAKTVYITAIGGDHDWSFTFN